MISSETKVVAAKAKQHYEASLREELEQTAFGQYVAIEPDSGDYFLGESFDDAVNAAITKYPDRLTQTTRNLLNSNPTR